MLPSPDVLNEYEHGRFILSNLAAKRARDIRGGANPLVRIDSTHPLTIALAEIAAGLVRPRLSEDQYELEDVGTEAIGTDVGILLPGIDDDEVMTADTLISDDLDDIDLDDESGDPDADSDPDGGPTALTDLVEDDVDADADDDTEETTSLSLSDLEEEEEASADDDSEHRDN